MDIRGRSSLPSRQGEGAPAALTLILILILAADLWNARHDPVLQVRIPVAEGWAAALEGWSLIPEALPNPPRLTLKPEALPDNLPLSPSVTPENLARPLLVPE